MCRVLNVKPSSYYDWTNREISEQQIHRNHCELLVRAAHNETEERYGVDRLHAKLIEQGHDISLYMVRRIKEDTASNVVTISALQSLLTPIIISLSIQTCWIKSLMLSVQMSLGSVKSLIFGLLKVCNYPLK